MKVTVAAAAAALLLASGPAWAQQQGVKPTESRPTGMGQQGTALTEQTGREPLSGTDKQAMGVMAQSHVAQMQMGQLAIDQADGEAAKMFGRWVATSHGFAMRELAMIAGLRNEQPTMDVGEQAKTAIDRLRPLKGVAFNRAFVEAQMAELERGLAAAQKEGSNGNDRLLKGYAENTIPLFQAQLDEAKALRQALPPAK